MINQASLDVVLMLLSPLAHGKASEERSQIITQRTRPPTAPAPTRGLIRLLSSLNIPRQPLKKKMPELGGGGDRSDAHALVCGSTFRRHGRRWRTAGRVNAGGVGRQTKARQLKQHEQ